MASYPCTVYLLTTLTTSFHSAKLAKTVCVPQGERRQFNQSGQPGKVALELYKALTDIQQERTEDIFGWVYPV